MRGGRYLEQTVVNPLAVAFYVAASGERLRWARRAALDAVWGAYLRELRALPTFVPDRGPSAHLIDRSPCDQVSLEGKNETR